MGKRNKKADLGTAVAYLRVSTDEQKLGMEAQWFAIKAWAERNGVTVAYRCEDLGVSGGAELEDRPALLEALELVRSGKAGRFIAHKADRLGRDAWLTGCIRRDIRKMGAELTLAEGMNGDSPEARVMATLEDAFAEYERAKIKARTKAALAAKKRKSEKTGGALPFGFRLMADGVHLEPCPSEHPVLVRILDLRRAGMGGRRIAKILDKEGYRPRGAIWNPGNLQTMADRHLHQPS
jgi:DNA invertase Pin-like site-specific DNA recombinase